MKPLRRIRALFRKEKLDADMAEELRAHMELRIAKNIAAGMSPEEARFAAMRAFGGVEQIKERCRDERRRGWIWLEQFLQDVRYALRSLRRSPGFTATIVLTLAVAIGGNAAIFSVLNAVLLEPLPYAHVERLVNLRETRPLAGGTGVRVPVPVSPATYFDWRDGVSAFEQIAAVGPTEVTFTGDAEPEQIAAAGATANLFPMLGVAPALGRNFLPEENQPGSVPVALLSHGFWQRRFGGESSAVGQTLTLNGKSITIVGVLPEYFDGAAAAGIARRMRPDVWFPLTLVQAGAPRSVPAYDVHARLKSGVTRADAQREVDAVMQRLAKEFPQTNAARGAQVESMADRVVGEVRANLWVLFGAVGFVLLIACANVANLLLARATLRAAETSMRAALGASRARLIRQFLTESLLLAVGGCVLGLLAAIVCVDACAYLLPSNLPRAEHVAIDGRVVAFTMIVSLLTGLVFGLAPAWQSARTDLQAAIKTGGRSGPGTSEGTRLRNTLVVAQVALSVVLLVGAGLLWQSFAALAGVDPGFDPRNVLTFRVTVMGEKYRAPEQRIAFFEQLSQHVKALPGVHATALVFPLPFSGPIQNSPFSIPGRPVDPALELSAEVNLVSPEYFQALGIRVTQGRAFTERDRVGSAPVAMINETLARRIWPGESPLGKRIAFGRSGAAEREIVGVFADIKQRQLDSGPLLQGCIPQLQQPTSTLYLAVRGTVPAPTLLPAIKERMAALDRNLPTVDLALWSDRIAGAIAPRRATTWLLGVFAATALSLAVLGLYGVMSYVVAQRTREFGIRVALGAQWRDLRQLVLGRGLKLVAVGIAIGVVAALALSRVVRALLFEVSATDPVTFISVGVLLALASLLACWLPARRAARVDPVIALRAE